MLQACCTILLDVVAAVRWVQSIQGTCPGLSLVQAHTNRLIRDFDANIMLVTGPGHGAPGVLSGLWLEGSSESMELLRERTDSLKCPTVH